MDARGLSAVDMYGLHGTLRRRRIVLVEFIAGAVVGILLGLWVIGNASGTATRVFGAYLIAAGLNYVPLSWYAIRFSHAGALEAELRDADVPAQLRRYGVWQLWLLVPLSMVVSAATTRRAGRR